MTPPDAGDGPLPNIPNEGNSHLQMPAGQQPLYAGLTPVQEQSQSSSKKHLSGDEKSFCDNSNIDEVSLKGGRSPFLHDDQSGNAKAKEFGGGNGIKLINNPEK